MLHTGLASAPHQYTTCLLSGSVRARVSLLDFVVRNEGVKSLRVELSPTSHTDSSIFECSTAVLIHAEDATAGGIVEKEDNQLSSIKCLFMNNCKINNKVTKLGTDFM